MKRLNGWSVAVVLLSLVGCKGGGSGGPATPAEFCIQYAEAVCQIATPCGVTPETCTNFQQSLCTANSTQAMADIKRTYNVGNAQDCINKVKAAYGSSSPITPPTLATIDRACNYAFQGKGVQLTDTCTTAYDCAGATDGTIICDPSQHLCAKTITVGGTQQCSAVGDVCAQDYYCATNASNVQICTAAAASGEACSATVPCAHGLRCAGGACSSLIQATVACSADSDCVSTAPYCDPYTTPSKCDSGLLFAAGSNSCNCLAMGPACNGGSTGAGGAGGSSGTAGTNGAGGSSGAAGTNGAGGTSGAGGITGAGGLGLGGLGGNLGLGGLGGLGGA
jgi:hypothetical protein